MESFRVYRVVVVIECVVRKSTVVDAEVPDARTQCAAEMVEQGDALGGPRQISADRVVDGVLDELPSVVVGIGWSAGESQPTRRVAVKLFEKVGLSDSAFEGSEPGG